MSYSLQLYTLRNAIQEDLPGTIRKVAEIGFTQVEPYNFVATAKELGAALKENGLTAPSGHAPLLSQDQDEIFAAAKELGITTVIDPYLPADHWQKAEDIQATAAKLNAAAKKGAEYGIRVGYHNHPGSWSPASRARPPWSTSKGCWTPNWSSKWTPTGLPWAARTRWRS
jgi:sugar phosphate isomerase/epimerase